MVVKQNDEEGHKTAGFENDVNSYGSKTFKPRDKGLKVFYYIKKLVFNKIKYKVRSR